MSVAASAARICTRSSGRTTIPTVVGDADWPTVPPPTERRNAPPTGRCWRVDAAPFGLRLDRSELGPNHKLPVRFPGATQTPCWVEGDAAQPYSGRVTIFNFVLDELPAHHMACPPEQTHASSSNYYADSSTCTRRLINLATLDGKVSAAGLQTYHTYNDETSTTFWEDDWYGSSSELSTATSCGTAPQWIRLLPLHWGLTTSLSLA
nr:unnamed protein product [Digitaria exilis]